MPTHQIITGTGRSAKMSNSILIGDPIGDRGAEEEAPREGREVSIIHGYLSSVAWSLLLWDPRSPIESPIIISDRRVPTGIVVFFKA